MNKIAVILLLVTVSTYSQNRYTTLSTSTYTPLSFDEISYVANQKRSQYNQNQNYLYSLKDWIRELSSKITVEEFRNRLQKEYNDLVKTENADLARYSTYLRQTEDAVKSIIHDYNNYVSNNNYSIGSQGSYGSSANYIQNLAAQGLELFFTGNYASAISNFSKCLEVDNTNTDILFARGLAKSNYGDIEGAMSDYDKIIELHSNYPMEFNKLATVYNNKAYCLVTLKRYNEALPFVEKALELDKTEWFIWDTRGEIYYNLGMYDKAIQDVTKAISIYDNENSRRIRGLSYSKLGDTKKSNKDLKKAEKLKNK